MLLDNNEMIKWLNNNLITGTAQNHLISQIQLAIYYILHLKFKIRKIT